jgi:hypothetical protein
MACYSFGDAAAARTLLDATASWQRCAGDTLTITADDRTVVWHMDGPRTVGGVHVTDEAAQVVTAITGRNRV